MTSQYSSHFPLLGSYFKLRTRVHSHLLMSTLTCSRLFRLPSLDNLTQSINMASCEAHAGGFVWLPTLAFGNITRMSFNEKGSISYSPSEMVVQVTSNGVYLLEYDLGLDHWRNLNCWTVKDSSGRNTEIVKADVNQSQIFVALTGGRVALCR